MVMKRGTEEFDVVTSKNNECCWENEGIDVGRINKMGENLI